MARIILLGFSIISCTLVHGINLPGDQRKVEVSFCCEEGKTLIIRKQLTECVVNNKSSGSLEGLEVWVGLDEKELRHVQKLGVKRPSCQRGIKYGLLDRNITLVQGDFCLTKDWMLDYQEMEGLLYLTCDPCEGQVMCFYARKMFDTIDYRHTGKIRNNLFWINHANISSDTVIDFEMYYEILKESVKHYIKLLDENNDGSIYEEASEGDIFKKLSLNLFEKIVNIYMEILDSDKDNTISLDDAALSSMVYLRDRNKVSLSEALITLPAPLYRLYTQLDRNMDDKLSREEAIDFIRRTFILIDFNSDCYIDVDEIVHVLRMVEIPWDYQLAVKLILEQYLTLGSFIVKHFVEKADMNNDGRVTIMEVFGFRDFSFIDWIKPVVVDMGTPTGAMDYLQTRPWTTQLKNEELVSMWLNGLQNLLELPTYSAARQELGSSCMGS